MGFSDSAPDFATSLTAGEWALIGAVIVIIAIWPRIAYCCWKREGISPQVFPNGDIEMN